MFSREKRVELIKEISDAFGPSGMENDVCKIGQRETQEHYEAYRDNLKNQFFEKKMTEDEIHHHHHDHHHDHQNAGPVIWFDAHSDEVGFIVQAIKPNGTLEFLTLGGMNEGQLPGTKVVLKNRDGEFVQGVISSKPPHFMTEEEKKAPVTVSQLVIDMGAVDKEDAEQNFRVGIGTFAAPSAHCTFDEEKGIFIGKAFDCRMGCAALIETLDELKDDDLVIRATMTSQEEVGARGAKGAKDVIDADYAILFEGCPADDTFSPEYRVQNALRKGPSLRHFDKTMITNPEFMAFVLQVAEDNGIPVQETVRSGGGTNGMHIHMTRTGIPTIVIGIPIRYIHSAYGIATLEDYENAVKLGVALARAIQEVEG